VSARKIGLLLVILGFGAVVETAWSVRHHVDLGPAGCRVLGGKFYGPSFAFEEGSEETVAAGTRVEVDNAFGEVRVGAGQAGRVRIGLRKVVFLPTEARAREFASGIAVRTSSTGSALRISTNREDVARRDDEVGFETHFTIEVPPDTAVTVRNEHGRVELADVAEADVENSFEELRIERVAGAASLRNRHGGVQVLKVGGDLTVRARHGDVEVEDAPGRVSLDVQHGDARCTRVGGLVVEQAHGDLKAETVKGDLEVHAKHGTVAATDVSGNADVETSFDGVHLSRIGGEAKVRTEHGEVRASGVKGALSAEATYNGVFLEQIEGPVEVAVVHGGLEASGLGKGARVKAAGDDVTLEGFRGPVEIESRRGAVHLVPAGALTEPLTVSTVNGGIRLEVPAGSRFVLEATSRRGEVQVEVPGITITRTQPGRVQGSLAGGGSTVKLSAEGGDVSVEARSKSASGEI
jgi:DUF4097 and DUF4098 domain-containing protein YvlB